MAESKTAAGPCGTRLQEARRISFLQVTIKQGFPPRSWTSPAAAQLLPGEEPGTGAVSPATSAGSRLGRWRLFESFIYLEAPALRQSQHTQIYTLPHNAFSVDGVYRHSGLPLCVVYHHKSPLLISPAPGRLTPKGLPSDRQMSLLMEGMEMEP